MNVITAYLETMFSTYPQTPRLLEAKTELQTMMEDAYTALITEGHSENEAVGRVITEFGNLDELAPVLGITNDISPAPAGAGNEAVVPGVAGEHSATTAEPQRPRHPAVTPEEAKGFAEAHRRTRFRTATAIVLFILAAIPIVLLPSAAADGLVDLSAGIASGIGILVLFVVVAIGIIMIIGVGKEFTPYRNIRKGKFSRNPSVTRWAEEFAQQHERGRSTALQFAIVCWVLSPVPVLLFTLMLQGHEHHDFLTMVGVAGTLVLVAIGLLILLPAAWAHSAAETLTAAGGSAASGQHDDGDRSIVSVIASIYWPVIVVIFLAWSFIGDAWGRSWIIWPIAGVLFGAIAAGSGAIESYRKQRR